MNQAEFAATPRARSQCDAILSVLTDRGGDWVSMVDLWKASGAFAVHSRISDLRQRGYTIDQKNVRTADRAIHSYYRLRQNMLVPSKPREAVAKDLQTELMLT